MRVVKHRRVVWAIESFVPYKSPGVDGIFPALLLEGKEILVPYLLGFFAPTWLLAMFQQHGVR
jgi:hypothetical protein